MHAALTVLRHLLSILALPVTVTCVIPFMLLARRPADPSLLSIAGGAPFLGLGLALVVVTNWRFATVGRGTLAPWDPPRNLVVHGIYRHVRNPMITGVVLILIGEAIAFRSRALAEWTLLFAAINATYIPLLEEPMLENRFGRAYCEYCRNVPRWIPRRTPWRSQP